MQQRDERNSNCGIFLAIIFVLMIFGNHSPPEDRAVRRDHYGWGSQRVTTYPPLVDLDDDKNSSAPDHNGHHSYSWPPTVDPEVQRRNQQSARVVVFLFGSLMFVQILGFCVAIALRRRALNRARHSDLFNVVVSREDTGWEDDSDSEDVIESHPALASLRSAMTAEPGLPSYNDAVNDPDLPDYAVHADPPPPITEPSVDFPILDENSIAEVQNSSLEVENVDVNTTQAAATSMNVGDSESCRTDAVLSSLSQGEESDFECISDDSPLIVHSKGD